MVARAKEEQTARAHLSSKTFVNGNVNSSNPVANNSALESALSVNGLTAKVLVKQGTACKVKWFKDNKPVTVYYSRNFVQSEALAFINAYMA